VKALFISFPAADYEASKAFYENVIGLPVDRESDDGPHRFTNYKLGGLVRKIIEWADEWHGAGHSGLFIETEELDSVIDRVRTKGGGRSCTVQDPFGNLFDLIDANMNGDA